MKLTKVYRAKDFDYSVIRKIPDQKRKKGNPGTKRKFWYKDIVCAFDIETTNVPFCDCAIMYVWQFQLGHIATIVGRTWNEFRYMCEEIKRQLWSEQRIVIYVHNLSFEFHFLHGIYAFKKEEVFCVKPRKILRCSMFQDRLEFRCSYLHSNMSLDTYTHKMKVDHPKQSGEKFNYNRIRFPWTPLRYQELKYAIFDVVGLVEAVEAEMAFDNDNLYTIPLTSTGYVRRDVKNAMRAAGIKITDILPDYEVYQMCREEFRGGDTHANRFYVKKHLYQVESHDRSSSYPDVICNCLFPMSKFEFLESPTAEEMLKLIGIRGKASLMRATFTNLRLADYYNPAPYLPRDKSRNLVNGVFDNGRVLAADSLEITINDIDLTILAETYTWDAMEISKACVARYGKLPQPIIDMNIEYYRRKTELKGVEGDEAELLYMKSKNKLNSIYGMMAQLPVKQNIEYIHGDYVETEIPELELLEKNNKKAFLSYAWACWVTSWARWRLYEGIRLCGRKHVYNDTDCCKHFPGVDFTEYNQKRIANSKASGAYAVDSKGVTHYMGVYEAEHLMEEFATLGAKKYCYKEKDGKLRITIAGVTKKLGGEELERSGGIERFVSDDTFTFRDAGGLEAIYDDNLTLRTVEIDGHTLPITANISLVSSTYTLGITEEYRRLLEGLTVL